MFAGCGAANDTRKEQGSWQGSAHFTDLDWRYGMHHARGTERMAGIPDKIGALSGRAAQ